MTHHAIGQAKYIFVGLGYGSYTKYDGYFGGAGVSAVSVGFSARVRVRARLRTTAPVSHATPGRL